MLWVAGLRCRSVTKVALNARVSAETHSQLLKEAEARGLNYPAFLEYLAKAFSANGVFIVERPTYTLVMEEVLNQVAKTSRKIARLEANMVLVERGFISNPYR
jgi:hypothetical protein